MRKKHGLGDALSPAARQTIADETYGPVIAAIGTLLDAGKTDGSIRDDADAGDFLQLTGALWRAVSGASDRSALMLGLILDGLAAKWRHRRHCSSGEPSDPPRVIAIRMPAIDRSPKLAVLVRAIQTTLRPNGSSKVRVGPTRWGLPSF